MVVNEAEWLALLEFPSMDVELQRPYQENSAELETKSFFVLVESV